jgi:predicted secreted protein
MRRSPPLALPFLRPLAIAAAILLVAPAQAAETVLHLAETATILTAPDELAATLRAEASATSASDAQARVNAMLARAASLAAETKGVSLATGGYQVWRAAPTPQERAEKWQASQSLRLVSRDGPTLLTLVGALQQQGLATSALHWRLSPETERKSRQDATRQAVRALRGRATETAELLALRFDHFRAVRLDGNDPSPAPRAMMAMARGADAAPPPVAVAEDIHVTATVQAEAVLIPR